MPGGRRVRVAPGAVRFVAQSNLALQRQDRSVPPAGRCAPVLEGPGRKFALSLCPAMIAGAVLTLVFYRYDLFPMMPGAWLLLYGVAVVTGGAFSVRVVPIMGVSFMAIGTLALFSPFRWANWFMAALV